MNLANGNPHHNMTMNNNLSNPKLSSYAKNRSQSNTLKGASQISTLSHSNHKPSNLSTNLITPTSSENNSELTFTDTELAMARDNTLLHKGESILRQLIIRAVDYWHTMECVLVPKRCQDNSYNGSE